jgi:hypothetical protein
MRQPVTVVLLLCCCAISISAQNGGSRRVLRLEELTRTDIYPEIMGPARTVPQS